MIWFLFIQKPYDWKPSNARNYTTPMWDKTSKRSPSETLWAHNRNRNRINLCFWSMPPNGPLGWSQQLDRVWYQYKSLLVDSARLARIVHSNTRIENLEGVAFCAWRIENCVQVWPSQPISFYFGTKLGSELAQNQPSLIGQWESKRRTFLEKRQTTVIIQNAEFFL